MFYDVFRGKETDQWHQIFGINLSGNHLSILLTRKLWAMLTFLGCIVGTVQVFLKLWKNKMLEYKINLLPTCHLLVLSHHHKI